MRAHIVTGASRGLGLALTHALLAQQGRVIGIARHAPPMLDAQTKNHFHFIAADLSNPTPITALMSQMMAALGSGPFESIDLINNAGVVTPVAQAGNYPPQAVIDAFHINLIAPILLTNAFLAKAVHYSNDVRVLNISSGAAVNTYPGWGVYGASKAALDHFSRHATAEQAAQPAGARVVSLYPGVVDTDMQTTIRKSRAQDFPLKTRFDEMKAEGMLTPAHDTALQILRYLRCTDFGHEPVVDIRHLSFLADQS